MPECPAWAALGSEQLGSHRSTGTEEPSGAVGRKVPQPLQLSWPQDLGLHESGQGGGG